MFDYGTLIQELLGALDTHDSEVAEANLLYTQFVKPLESEHVGEYAAVSPKGDVLLGPTAIDVLERGKAAFGPGNFIFKVGQRTIGRWLKLRAE